MTQALNLDSFKKFGVTLAALACAVSLLFVQAPQAHAAGLTEVQIKAVTNLIEAFGGDPATVVNVGAILRAQAGQGAAPATTQTTTNTQTTTTSNQSSADTVEMNAGCPVFETTMQKGSTGAHVSALQTFLTSAGLLAAGNVTGTFGTLTEQAVIAFQGQNNIEPVGIVGPQTRAAITKKCSGIRDAAATHTSTTPGSSQSESQGSTGSLPPQTPANTYSGPHTPSKQACMSQDPSRDNADDRYMNPDVPSVKEFMDATGAAFSDATPVLSLGRMKDLRDWKAIMASANPLQAARDAIGALYNSGRTDYVWWQACKIEWLPKTTILASTQNFTFYKDEYPTGIIYRVGVHDSNGYLITVPANSFVLFDNIRNFGLDKAQLSSLQAQLDAKGIDQTKISSWPRNFKDPSISVGPAINIMAAIGMTVLSPYEWAVQNLTNALFEAGLY